LEEAALSILCQLQLQLLLNISACSFQCFTGIDGQHTQMKRLIWKRHKEKAENGAAPLQLN
jgi:hypothetical protein